jgi:hypothetical protein
MRKVGPARADEEEFEAAAFALEYNVRGPARILRLGADFIPVIQLRSQ